MTLEELEARREDVVELRGDDIAAFCDLMFALPLFDPIEKRFVYVPIPQSVRMATVIRGVRRSDTMNGRDWYFEPVVTPHGVPIP